MKTKVALVSFGCAKNLVDSEVMLGFLKKAGYVLAAEPESADVVILNTCGFIRPARDEAEAAIRGALSLKKRCPGLKVVAAGCYVQRNRAALAAAHPGVDHWLDVAEFDRIVPVLAGGRGGRARRTFLYSHLSPRVVSTPRGWAYVKISEGCSHRCAFCSIPLIKGPYRSRPAASIVEEVRRLAGQGVREVNLVSQDTTYYGRDLGRKDGLARLVPKLESVPGLEWIRLLYGYPGEVTEALLDVMTHAKVCPYFDLPFQHSDRSLLRRMGRSGDADRSLRLVDKIRKRVPGAVLRTALIVGLPGEGPAEFRSLERFVRRAAFDHLGVFTYSPEEGTPASGLKDTVPESVKRSRRGRLMRLQRDISRRRNERYLGRTLEVLLDAASPREARLALGRTRFQAPEVDGLVRVRTPGPAAGLLHDIRRVEITAAGVYDLRGRLIG